MKLKWLFRVLTLFFVGGICWLLVGITINFPPKSPLQKLDEARALWQVKGSPNYQMDIVFGSMMFLEGYRVTVRNSQIKEISEFPPLYNTPTLTPFDDTQDKIFQSSFFAQAILSDLKNYTVDALFDVASQKLADQTTPQLVSFCSLNSGTPNIIFNAEYGYIRSYELSSCSDWQIGGGLLCPKMGECHVGMGVRNFKLLPPN